MPGKQDATVVIPRYTTFVGQTNYLMPPIAVAAYSSINLTVWVGPLAGTTPTVSFAYQESIDGEDWQSAGGPPVTIAVSPVEFQMTAPLTKAWMRFLVAPAGAGVAVTCWAAGFFELRER